MPPISLPLLTSARTNSLVQLPPAPSVPATDADIKKAIRLTKQLLQISTEEDDVPDVDVVNGLVYAANLLVAHDDFQMPNQHADVEDEPPQWFVKANAEGPPPKWFTEAVATIDQKLSKIDERLIKIEIRNAKAFNSSRGTGDGVVYELVPFPDGMYPRANDNSLPLLESAPIVRGLTEAQLKKYYRKYKGLRHNTPVSTSIDDMRRFVFRAIGANDGID